MLDIVDMNVGSEAEALWHRFVLPLPGCGRHPIPVLKSRVVFQKRNLGKVSGADQRFVQGAAAKQPSGMPALPPCAAGLESLGVGSIERTDPAAGRPADAIGRGGMGR